MQVSRRKLRWALLSVVVLASLACSQRPSESDARQLLESYIRENYHLDTKGVQVLSLHKTDGLAEIKDGAKYYTMDYQAEIVFPEGERSWVSVPYDSGKSYKEDGRIRFVKAENGWRLLEHQPLKVVDTADAH